jgi:hypothetical protein
MAVEDQSMRTMRRTWVLALCLIAVGAFGDSTLTTDLFSVTIPDEWMEIPSEILTQVVAETRRASPGVEVPEYAFGYQLATAQHWVEYPYILVQVTETGRIAESELQNMAQIDMNAAVAESVATLPDLLSGYDFGTPIYDEGSNVVWIASGFEVAGVGPVRALIGLIPTQTGFLQFNAYALEETFETWSPVFRAITTSVKVVPDLRYAGP